MSFENGYTVGSSAQTQEAIQLQDKSIQLMKHGSGGAFPAKQQGEPLLNQAFQAKRHSKPSLHQPLPYQQQVFPNQPAGETSQMRDFKKPQLPLARIKKIMKVDDNVENIAADAPPLFSEACELFITDLMHRSWIHADDEDRRILRRRDMANAINRTDHFDFLTDVVPIEERRRSTPEPTSVPLKCSIPITVTKNQRRKRESHDMSFENRYTVGSSAQTQEAIQLQDKSIQLMKHGSGGTFPATQLGEPLFSQAFQAKQNSKPSLHQPLPHQKQVFPNQDKSIQLMKHGSGGTFPATQQGETLFSQAFHAKQNSKPSLHQPLPHQKQVFPNQDKSIQLMKHGSGGTFPATQQGEPLFSQAFQAKQNSKPSLHQPLPHQKQVFPNQDKSIQLMKHGSGGTFPATQQGETLFSQAFHAKQNSKPSLHQPLPHQKQVFPNQDKSIQLMKHGSGGTFPATQQGEPLFSQAFQAKQNSKPSLHQPLPHQKHVFPNQDKSIQLMKHGSGGAFPATQQGEPLFSQAFQAIRHSKPSLHQPLPYQKQVFPNQDKSIQLMKHGSGGAFPAKQQGEPLLNQAFQAKRHSEPSLHQPLPYQQQVFPNQPAGETSQMRDFKKPQLPLARIKKIMQVDDNVKNIADDAPPLFSEACELFITDLMHRSWIHAGHDEDGRILRRRDIANAIIPTDYFDFLTDVVPI